MLAGSLQAQFTEVEPGVQYAAGTRVGAVELGISLVIPAEWVGVNPPGTELFVLGSNTRPGMVVAMGDEVEGMEAAVQMLSEPLPVDDGLILQPAGEPQVRGRELTQRYAAQVQGQEITGEAHAMVSDQGMGIARWRSARSIKPSTTGP